MKKIRITESQLKSIISKIIIEADISSKVRRLVRKYNRKTLTNERVYEVMEKFNMLMGGKGVESIYPDAPVGDLERAGLLYVDTGSFGDQTVIYDVSNRKFTIGSLYDYESPDTSFDDSSDY